MKRFSSLLLTLLMLLSITGCSGAAQGSLSGQTEPVIESYTGIILEHFTEGGGTDAAECLKVETSSGETVVFTLTDDTVRDDFSLAAGVSVHIECQAYSDSEYRPIISLQRSTLVSVDVGEYFAALSLPSDWCADEVALISEPDAAVFGFGLSPVSDPEFTANFLYYPSRVGICATGMTLTEFDLPLGAKVHQYVEEINGTVWFHLFISFSEDLDGTLLLEGSATPEQWAAYGSELHDILMSLALMSEDRGIDF